MPTTIVEEQIETSAEWCRKHRKKSLPTLSQFPLAFLIWPELPILPSDSDHLEELSQEVCELCDLCGQTYRPNVLPVDGSQVGISKTVQGDQREALENLQVEYIPQEVPCVLGGENTVHDGESNDEESTDSSGPSRSEQRRQVTFADCVFYQRETMYTNNEECVEREQNTHELGIYEGDEDEDDSDEDISKKKKCWPIGFRK